MFGDKSNNKKSHFSLSHYFCREYRSNFPLFVIYKHFFRIIKKNSLHINRSLSSLWLFFYPYFFVFPMFTWIRIFFCSFHLITPFLISIRFVCHCCCEPSTKYDLFIFLYYLFALIYSQKKNGISIFYYFFYFLLVLLSLGSIVSVIYGIFHRVEHENTQRKKKQQQWRKLKKCTATHTSTGINTW